MKAEWFAGRLRELRDAAGLTQEQLAERAGMAWRTITHLEGGDRKPAWETVLALCQALGVEVGEFTKEPAAPPEHQRGRPRKPGPAEEAPKRPRGRPPKSVRAARGKKPKKSKAKGRREPRDRVS